jgi:SAM-dependent methyltransferase
MHYTAQENAERFFQNYIYPISDNLTIVETGAQIGGFNIRSLAKNNIKYIGVDIDLYPGVDIKLDDPYILPFEDNSIDCVISSSCFEHIDFFWLTFLEIMRILKPNGLFYLNAPSNGDYHRYPIDSWRFYPDSCFSLSEWAKRHKYNCDVIERYTSNSGNDIWSDYVSIFIKDVNQIDLYQNRIINNFTDFKNGSIYPHTNLINKKMWNQ